jgi:hypothetical protein
MARKEHTLRPLIGLIYVIAALSASGCGGTKNQQLPNAPVLTIANVVLISTVNYDQGPSNRQTKWVLKNTGEKMAYHVWIQANTGSYFFEVDATAGTLAPSEIKDIRSPQLTQFSVLEAIHWSEAP